MDYLEKNTWTIAIIIIVILVIIFFYKREMFTVGKISNGNPHAELPYVENANMNMDSDLPPSWEEFKREHKDY